MTLRADPCFECGAPAECHHHVVPRVFGGTKTVPLCDGCHSKAHGVDGRKAWTKSVTRAALAAKQRRGELTGTAPIGATVAEDGRTLIPDPVELGAVTLIRELRADGLSYGKIADELNRRGVPARGSRWFAMTCQRVIARTEAA
jgi:hypothetical protein